MSKLAAICAKLKGDAVSVTKGQAGDDVSGGPVLPLFPPPLEESVIESDDDDSVRQSPTAVGGASVFPSALDSPTSLADIPTTVNEHSAIGVLKRKSIMSHSGVSATGASRRKRSRPAASSSTGMESNGLKLGVSGGMERLGGWTGDDETNSMDGSEHSLHIDLPDDRPSEHREASGGVRGSPFMQYSGSPQPNTSQANTGVLQALGLTGLSSYKPEALVSNIMASQSLAALAQQASSLQTGGSETQGRVASPASLSGDSLNDSHGRVSLSAAGKTGGDKAKKVMDYTKYMARYTNAKGCGTSYCRGMNYREHFHCIDCHSRIFVKKEEMIRHYKWHKKREDSLQHGFMRYSPFDDCSTKFAPCTHNKKQTHYHCIQAGCNKVYVSTSDVQMHANYHRKASAIIMEGFQRFRATEDCGTQSCDFYSQRTTHFHCRRPNCNFTFKNKADMEKHKTYHQKDEILAKDGFKKYMKYEHCPYQGCAYSKLSNHIHCMRPGCQYVLHSTSQLYPHKRKHEKRDLDAPIVLHTPNTNPASQPPIQLASGTIVYPVKGVYNGAKQEEMEAGEVSSKASQDKHETSDSAAVMPNATAASDLLSTVARLSQGLMPLEKDGKTPPMNPFIPAAKGKQPPGLLNSCTTAAARTASQKQGFVVSPQTKTTNEGSGTEASSEADDDTVARDSSIVEEEAGSDGNDETPSEQVFDKSLNLTPGRVLEPAAMNWKTERSSRLSEKAKSMMGHFKIAGMGDGASANGRAGPEKDKSELWKKYLTRYTANDPCNPRCWLLYKDHYHCNVDKCFNAFKSKDGVRDHARLHDNQEKISEQLYAAFGEKEDCGVTSCDYRRKAQHFHCKWIRCNKAIPLDEDVFARLDHFQEHELSARITQSTSRRLSALCNSLNSGVKSAGKSKRGRPPKHAPSVFAQQMINEDLVSGGDNKHQKIAPRDKDMNYGTYDENNLCPDELCVFRQEKHYHCSSERCHHVTNRPDVINLHSINFHKYITIPENYAYFDRNVNCRGFHCSNNRNSCHYHCLRPGCDHSFIRHTTVQQHDKRHATDDWNPKRPTKSQQTLKLLADNIQKRVAAAQQQTADAEGKSAEPGTSSRASAAVAASVDPTLLLLASQLSQLSGAKHQSPASSTSKPSASEETMPSPTKLSASGGCNKTVKASGTFFPQTGKPEDSMTADIADDSSNASSIVEADSVPPTSHPSTQGIPEGTSLASPLSAAAAALGGGGGGEQSQNQATMLLNLLTQMWLIQQKAAQVQQTKQQEQKTVPAGPSIDDDTWQKMLGRMYASPQVPCGNTFCKKKQVEHYHCLECGAAFNTANEQRLKSHIMKHSRYSGVQSGSRLPAAGSEVTNRHSAAAGGSTGEGAHSRLEGLSPETAGGINQLLLQALTRQNQIQSRSTDESSTSEAALPDSSTGVDRQQMAPIITPTSTPSQQPQQHSNNHQAAIQEMMMKALQLQVINNNNNNNSSSAASANISQGQRDTKVTVQAELMTTENEDTEISESEEEEEEVIPKMYKKFTKAGDCGYSKCIHSGVSVHYHCLREECNYSVTEISRLTQHTQRHEKLDKIMGEDFRLYKKESDCGRSDCEFANKASHFHCLLCPYMCTDANRILPHRKNHGTASSSLSHHSNNGAAAGFKNEKIDSVKVEPIK